MLNPVNFCPRSEHPARPRIHIISLPVSPKLPNWDTNGCLGSGVMPNNRQTALADCVGLSAAPLSLNSKRLTREHPGKPTHPCNIHRSVSPLHAPVVSQSPQLLIRRALFYKSASATGISLAGPVSNSRTILFCKNEACQISET
jgi:hypothetical protein